MNATEAETLSQVIAALARYAAEEALCPTEEARINRELARVDLRSFLRILDVEVDHSLIAAAKEGR